MEDVRLMHEEHLQESENDYSEVSSFGLRRDGRIVL